MTTVQGAFFLGWAAGWVSVAVMLSVFVTPYVDVRRRK